MQGRNKVFLSAIILASLGIILVVVLFVALNQPGKTKRTTTSVSSPELKSVYPSPQTVIGAQAVYPPSTTRDARPTNTAIPLKPTNITAAAQGTLTVNDVPRTPLKDAKAAFDGKKALFLDVRTAQSFARNHVAGAISIPEAQILERMNELDPNQWIIAYCS